MKLQTLCKATFILLFIPFYPLNGQVNRCVLNLIKAQEQFSAGQIEEIPELLLDCIEKGFSPEDRIEAFKLLINAYIFDGFPDLAEKHMIIFLNEYPEYQVKEDDPYEFVVLFEQFDNHPRYSIGSFTGINFNSVMVTQPFGVYNVNEVKADYSGIPGFQIGAGFNYYLNPKLEVSAEAMFVKSGFDYEVKPFPFTTTQYSERYARIELPVSLLYAFHAKQISPYLRMGMHSSLLISASGESVRSYSNTGGVDINDISGNRKVITKDRNLFNLSPFVGTGARYKLTRAYMFLDVRYHFGLIPQVLPETRHDARNDDIWLFYHQQDDFTLNMLSISLGYVRVFYNPRRKN
ncbi:MAG: outer membrane beta-barrel protein [Bacteroidota bacterium]